MDATAALVFLDILTTGKPKVACKVTLKVSCENLNSCTSTSTDDPDKHDDESIECEHKNMSEMDTNKKCHKGTITEMSNLRFDGSTAVMSRLTSVDGNSPVGANS